MNELAALAAKIDAAHAEGKTVTVNGRPVRTWSSTPTTIWGTGSLSIDVRSKRGTGVAQYWIKPGQLLPVIEIN